MPRATERLITPARAHHQTPSSPRTVFGGERDAGLSPGFTGDDRRLDERGASSTCPAADLGRRIAVAEEHLRCWEIMNDPGREFDPEEEHLMALLDCLSRQLEWVQALTTRGIFVQLQQLRLLILKSCETIEDQESAEHSLRMQRLATLIGLSLRAAADIGPTEYGQQTLWPNDRSFIGVAETAGLDLPLLGD